MSTYVNVCGIVEKSRIQGIIRDCTPPGGICGKCLPHRATPLGDLVEKLPLPTQLPGVRREHPIGLRAALDELYSRPEKCAICELELVKKDVGVFWGADTPIPFIKRDGVYHTRDHLGKPGKKIVMHSSKALTRPKLKVDALCHLCYPSRYDRLGTTDEKVKEYKLPTTPLSLEKALNNARDRPEECDVCYAPLFDVNCGVYWGYGKPFPYTLKSGRCYFRYADAPPRDTAKQPFPKLPRNPDPKWDY